MKRIRFGSASLLLALALGFALTSIANSSAEEGPSKCNCLNPRTGNYGVVINNECLEQDCWLEID